MRIASALIVGIAGVGVVLVARAQDTHGGPPPSEINERLRRELLEMVDRDQQARSEFMQRSDEQFVARLKEVDAKNTRRMKAIVAQYGWPGNRLVGSDGAHAAWLLIQHATGDVELMKDCLRRMERAVDAGDASRIDLAYLTDRVRMLEGRPQMFGTQFHQDSDGRLQPWKIEDEGHLDQRRKSVGLPTMAQYKKLLGRYTGKEPERSSDAK